MRYLDLFKKFVGCMVVFSLAFSCSEAVPEIKVDLVQAQKVKSKNIGPSCCSKKPSRFLAKGKYQMKY
jgi:hypothetical protein